MDEREVGAPPPPPPPRARAAPPARKHVPPPNSLLGPGRAGLEEEADPRSPAGTRGLGPRTTWTVA